MMIECHIDDRGTLRFIPIPKNAGTSIISVMFDLHGTVEEMLATQYRVENLYAEDVALWEKVCAARARDLPL